MGPGVGLALEPPPSVHALRRCYAVARRHRRAAAASAVATAGPRGLPDPQGGGAGDEAVEPVPPQPPGWWEKEGADNMVDVVGEDALRNVLSTAFANPRCGVLVVVEFFTPWCNGCRALYPKLVRIARDEPEVLFIKVNYDENRSLCRRLNVTKLPFAHFYNGSGIPLATMPVSLAPGNLERFRLALAEHKTPRCTLKDTDAARTFLAQPPAIRMHAVELAWKGPCAGDECEVLLAGDPVGGWSELVTLRKRHEDGAFVCMRKLPTGTYRFKFIVDGAWLTSDDYEVVEDSAGNTNNQVIVGASAWPFEWYPSNAEEAQPPPLLPELQGDADVLGEECTEFSGELNGEVTVERRLVSLEERVLRSEAKTQRVLEELAELVRSMERRLEDVRSD